MPTRLTGIAMMLTGGAAAAAYAQTALQQSAALLSKPAARTGTVSKAEGAPVPLLRMVVLALGSWK
jgi:hypothetical protein